MKEVIPDYVHAIIGWRAWTSSAEPPRLLSTNFSVWPTLAPFSACCTILRPDLHRSPCVDCGCGVYAYKRLEDLEGRPSVFGTVALWGKVFEHDTGYRAEYAYPLRLYSTVEDISGVAQEYGVPFALLKQPVSVLRLTDGTEMNFAPLWPKYCVEVNLSEWSEIRRGLGLPTLPGWPLRFHLQKVDIRDETLLAFYQQDSAQAGNSCRVSAPSEILSEPSSQLL